MTTTAKTRPTKSQQYALAEMLRAAEGELGVQELPGRPACEQILKYLRTTTLPRSMAEEDETPWCSAFVNWCVKQAGLTGTNSAAARSWQHWGLPTTHPAPGCVAVFSRGHNPALGHVGFYLESNCGDILILGGNQNDRVSVHRTPAGRLIGYRLPNV